MVSPDGRAGGETVPAHPDPLAALNSQFVDERSANTPDKWASIVFHNGSPRILCGKLFAGELPPPGEATKSPTAAPIVQKGYVEVVNKAPLKGTCQTPVWVGIHAGTFDTYDRNAPISEAFERLVEDGNNEPISMDFAMTEGAVWDATVGEGAPICPGESSYIPFEITLVPDTVHYFSYASMILPSNDAFVANGDPLAFPLFSESGTFLPVRVESMGNMALDGGTEVNDEVPMNTAFFGQTVPNTGVDENGVVLSHPGFKPKGRGGILDSRMFANADFTEEGYQFMEISVYLGEKPECELEFILFDADEDVPLRPLEEVECVMENEFNIQARPTAGCSTTRSADMEITGPIREDRLENAGPYMVFGDSRGAIFGRSYREGDYTISASIFSERSLQGDLVVERTFDFTVEECSRRLRAHF